jgi:cellulose 1,4-beta-cellobiosidase
MKLCRMVLNLVFQSLGPDDKTCAANCALEGADYSATYGAVASGNSLKLTFVTKGTYATNIGSRLYLMASDTAYQQFSLLNQEFTFDVDVSNLPCGLNGALYFVSMDKDGGMSKYPTNKAGAKYGTGYCDSQCPRDLKFINGQVRASQDETFASSIAHEK